MADSTYFASENIQDAYYHYVSQQLAKEYAMHFLLRCTRDEMDSVAGP